MLVTTTREVSVDVTKHYDYGKLVGEEISEYAQVEVTDDLHLGGIHAQRAWRHWFEYLGEWVWRTNFAEEIVAHGNSRPAEQPGDSGPHPDRAVRILSLGCGHGGVELSIATELRRPYELVAVDLNSRLFAEAKKTAVAKGLSIQWDELDLNFVQIQEGGFDVIFAHASLHHLLNLEHVFEQVYRGLKPDGRFVVLDMIGKSHVLFWRENLDVAVEVVRLMPEQYKPGVSDPLTVVAPYTISYVGMEGIRQEEIPLLVARWFDPVKLFTYGSFMRIICTHPVIGKALDPGRPEDRQYLERLFEYDLRLIREGTLRPTEMFAVLKKKPEGGAAGPNPQKRREKHRRVRRNTQ